ncbi:MAG: phage tail protein [Erythrobacter sp.]|nr:phage tail protein [Erythrobacter sp.]
MRKLSRTVTAIATLGSLGMFAVPAQAGADAYIGEVYMFGITFCPRFHVEANGQLLPIAQNTALFSLLGTQFGGDGRTTFAMPDLRGRVPIGQGNGPGLTSRIAGQQLGTETNTLTATNLPSHSHTAHVYTAQIDATTRSPVAATFANGATNTYYDGAPTGHAMTAGTATVDNTGSNQPMNNMAPSLAIRYCVVSQGIFPPRN